MCLVYQPGHRASARRVDSLKLIGFWRRAPRDASGSRHEPTPLRHQPAKYIALPLMFNSSVWLYPPWPGQRYELACPPLTNVDVCRRLSTERQSGIRYNGTRTFNYAHTECTEPERETAEVLSSLLVNCDRGCLFVDVGCNLGYFAAQAAALGASVDCYEPTPYFAAATRTTRRLNGWDASSLLEFNVTEAAIVSEHEVSASPTRTSRHLTRTFARPSYLPCGVGTRDADLRQPWSVPAVPIRQLVAGRHVTLLKVDIDSNDGALLHDVVRLISRGAASCASILIEYGDDAMPWAACEHEGNAASLRICRGYVFGKQQHKARSNMTVGVASPRGGDVRDLYTLQHELGYEIYRLNIHTNREILDWRGRNVNERRSPQQPEFEQLRSVRAMRVLERLRRDVPIERLSKLVRMWQSLLITREPLAEVVTHHLQDLTQGANVDNPMTLNEHNPALRAAMRAHPLRTDGESSHTDTRTRTTRS